MHYIFLNQKGLIPDNWKDTGEKQEAQECVVFSLIPSQLQNKVHMAGAEVKGTLGLVMFVRRPVYQLHPQRDSAQTRRRLAVASRGLQEPSWQEHACLSAPVWSVSPTYKTASIQSQGLMTSSNPSLIHPETPPMNTAVGMTFPPSRYH